MKLSYLPFFLLLITVAAIRCENVHEKFIYVEEIKDFLDDQYVCINHNTMQHAITTYDIVIDALQKLPPEKLELLKLYIEKLHEHELDVYPELEPLVRKKFKDKTYCNVLVKNCLLANNAQVCNDATLNNVTINGSLTLNSSECLDINCLTVNDITASFITTKTIIAGTIIGTVTGVIENAIYAEFFTQPLIGDVTGTQDATHVELVCGVPACTLAQAYSAALTATSADIPLTLVLRDSTGSFAATTITLTGCLVLTDALNNIAGTVCANTKALIVAPQTTRALQTTANGNTRGINAIDLQMVQNGSEVASGNYSGILSGTGNTASGTYSYVGGGFGNMATQAGSVVAGGGTDGTIFAGNSATGLASVVGGGINNTASGNYSGILTGSGNIASSAFATIGGGFNNIVSGAGSVILGGGTDNLNYAGNIVAAPAGFIGGGLGNIINSAAPYSAIASGSGNTVSAPFSLLGSGMQNIILAGASYSAMGSGENNILGAPFSGILSGIGNIVTGTGSVIGCGTANLIAAPAAFIGSGISNVINLSAAYSAIASGSSNVISAPFAIIAGGQANNILAGASYSVIGGGFNNTTSGSFSGALTGSGNIASGIGAVVCGGGTDGTNVASNMAAGNASFVGCGLGNSISAQSPYSAILCGTSNSITGASSYSVIAGGNSNSIKNAPSSFAAGTNVLITATGAFGWADSSAGIFTVTLANSFNIRCSGGARIASTAANNVGVSLAGGGSSWGSFSDVNFKTNITSVDPLATLSALCTITTYTWSYISQDPSIIHIGPMAQDVYNVFGYGEDPCYIGTSDAIGILAASIQALYQLYQAQPLNAPFMEVPITKKIVEDQQQFIDVFEERIKRLEDIVKKGGYELN